MSNIQNYYNRYLQSQTVFGVKMEYNSTESILSFCKSMKSKLDEFSGYQLQYKYIDSTYANRSTDELQDLITSISTYEDDRYTKRLLENFCYVRSDGSSFNSTSFLSTLRNKRLSIIGDSLAVQLMNAIDVELRSFVSREKSLSRDNIEDDVHHDRQMVNSLKSRCLGACFRFYPDYNVSILFHENFKGLVYDEVIVGDPEENECIEKFCNRALAVDIVIVSVGAHYKTGEGHNTVEEYFEAIKRNENELDVNMRNLRKKIESFHKSNNRFEEPLIIWRLNAHSGAIDLYNTEFGRKHNYPNSNENGIWDKEVRDAVWVQKYNDVLKLIALENTDYILDHHKLSIQMFDHELDRQYLFNDSSSIHIHHDHLHYLAGGLFRLSLVVLQDIIEHFMFCIDY